MKEKLFGLKFPPGLHNTGTTYQSKGRWRAGNCVRFTNGAIQPIGGWVPRSTSGATISGTPNAAISWQTNAGVSYLVIGTTNGLYAVTAGNIVYAITPAYSGPSASWQWQLETFGSYLIAVINETNNEALTLVPTNLFYWDGNVAAIAQNVGGITGLRNNPGSVFGVVTTPERFLFVLRGSDPVPFGGTPYPVTPGRID